ncbi:hypothetical protein [Mesorhizobium sp. WSM4982]|uniref:hypothetical protein n=1 Tax=Mesorhizobium sp. WSM4982 TaxID=3038550 RepID=UPI002414FE4F|nr:hypothetical protein [Mesorhizobium sp. WSM4982]MDG4856416.1 hypothetical protein [Mesorhizobium sp. WSM4982]
MLTNLILTLLYAYLIVAFVLTVRVMADGTLPAWLDRATAYGDGKLSITERFYLLLYAIPALVFCAWYHKWPGVKGVVAELYVAIVLGRQFNEKDAMK